MQDQQQLHETATRLSELAQGARGKDISLVLSKTLVITLSALAMFLLVVAYFFTFSGPTTYFIEYEIKHFLGKVLLVLSTEIIGAVLVLYLFDLSDRRKIIEDKERSRKIRVYSSYLIWFGFIMLIFAGNAYIIYYDDPTPNTMDFLIDVGIALGVQFVTAGFLYIIFNMWLKKVEEQDEKFDQLLAEIQALQGPPNPNAGDQSSG